MSFSPVYLLGMKRTPYLGNYLVSRQEEADWELLILRSLIKEAFRGIVPEYMIHSCSLIADRGAQLDCLKKDFEKIPTLFFRMDSSAFYGIEALWAASMHLETLSHYYLRGGGLHSSNEKAFILSERISREELFEREALDIFTHEKIIKLEKLSAEGVFSPEILPVLLKEHVSSVQYFDLLPNKSFSLEDLLSLPALVDKIRGTLTQGNSSSLSTAYAGLALSRHLEKAELEINEIRFFKAINELTWKEFVCQSLRQWEEVIKRKLSDYSLIEFVEISAAQSLTMEKALIENFEIGPTIINSFGGNLGRGICPSIESWAILGNFLHLSSEKTGLMIVTHSEGHLAFVQVRKL